MKILIISLSAGAGHVRVAEAIEREAKFQFPQIETKHIDLADYVSLVMKKTIVDSYAMMAKTIPALFGFLYDKTNSPKSAKNFNKFTNEIEKLSSLRLYNLVKEYQPDHIICTHFLPAQILLNSPDRFQLHIPPVSTVITDFDLHNLWLIPNTYLYFVANKKIAWKMSLYNIPKEKIIVSGIPINPIFYQNKSIEKLKSKYGIINNKKTVLILSGGQGMIDISETLKALFDSGQSLNIIAIAGKNKKLEKNLHKLVTPPNINFFIIGWTESIDEYMRIADIIVTKPGGSTVAECLALQKPIIIIDPIPGQEECNTDYILTNGFGQIARRSDDLLYYLEKWDFQFKKIISSEPATKIILKKIMQK